jgi:hypothetical protein
MGKKMGEKQREQWIEQRARPQSRGLRAVSDVSQEAVRSYSH